MQKKLCQYQKILRKAIVGLGIFLYLMSPAYSADSPRDNYQAIPTLSFTNLIEYQKQHPKANELFYVNHAGSEYSPIKLEASLQEPFIIDLSNIIATALENNINLNLARLDTKMSNWSFWQKFADALPDIQLRASSQKRDGTFYLNSQLQREINETIVNAGFRINYRVFNGGTTSFLALAEKYYRSSVSEHEKAVYQQILLDSVTYYFDLLQAQTSLFAQLKAFEAAKSNLELSEKFLKAGTGTKYDVLQAESILAQAQRLMIEREANFRNAQINLAIHLNQPLETPYLIDKNTIDVIRIVDEDMPIKDILHSAFQKNPNIISALKAKQGALKEGLATVGEFLPKVDIYADFMGAGENFGDMVGITTLGFDATYSIGEGLGLTTYTKAMQSKTKVQKAKLEYAREVQGIELGLRESYINLQKSRSMVYASQKELQSAQEAVRLSKLRYQNGLEIFANLIDKEKELIQAELSLINSTSNYNIAQAQLAYNMGIIQVENILGTI
jgi:OMF family outer membrane factor